MTNQVIIDFATPLIGDILTLTPMTGGANNQGYRVEAQTGIYFIKSFPPEHQASSYKLNNEYQFSLHLYQCGISSVVKPLAICKQNLLALYHFAEGLPIKNSKKENIQFSLDFITQINQTHITSSGKHLSLAAEHTTTLAGFADLVEKRITKLNSINNDDETSKDCLRFVNTVHDHLQNIKSNNVNLDWQAAFNANILSPSDFGFHNAIDAGSKLFFIDFEYAGFDSGWKLVADYFCQPQVPVDLSYISLFRREPLFDFLNLFPEKFIVAFELSLLKWSLIMLNEFDPEIQKRRVFSWSNSCLLDTEKLNNDEELDKLKKIKIMQLSKSKNYYQMIERKIQQLTTLLLI